MIYVLNLVADVRKVAGEFGTMQTKMEKERGSIFANFMWMSPYFDHR